jgi:hypothetical protein
LDVTDPEPLPPDSSLWSAANVIITAHTSGATPHYWDRAIELVVENIRRLRAGKSWSTGSTSTPAIDRGSSAGSRRRRPSRPIVFDSVEREREEPRRAGGDGPSQPTVSV